MALPAGDPPRRRWRVADLYELPDDRHRYEIVDGELLVTPPPSLRHQALVPTLYERLLPWKRRTGCLVLFGPGVPKGEFTWCEPDLVVYPPIAGYPDDYYGMPVPLLVLEVLSPGSRHHDRGPKRRAYADMGVHTYWTLDPKRRVIEQWGAGDEPVAVEGVRIETTLPGIDESLVLDLVALFAQLDAAK